MGVGLAPPAAPVATAVVGLLQLGFSAGRKSVALRQGRERLHSGGKLVVQLRVDPSGQSFKRLLVAEQSSTAAATSVRLLSGV